ncbi:PucR-like helix-turn-helix protein [Salsuginibacillus halophilus]|uniref:PucR-like helix-turn-helix protein n=1 Tax=Salsuginibacillus halophilus TaxID=517424 RepID=A0A2P8H874_9BACI|nr:helix-turn-helix domain-containing protein [Salsuginibacillus halophilus]PSL42433.1 PucR-like helix-turn-helix protein [Salsuginibacillus halophilus]
MTAHLRELYRTAYAADPAAVDDITVYEWFMDNTQHVFGILKEALPEREKSVLQAFLSPVPPYRLYPEEADHRWYRRLFQTADEMKKSYRFVHFAIKQAVDDYFAMQEALRTLSEAPAAVVWFDDVSGVVVLEGEEGEHVVKADVQAAVEALQVDFLIDMTALLGRVHQPDVFPQHASTDERRLLHSLPRQERVITVPEAATHALFQQAPKPMQQLAASIFTDPVDEELKQTIAVYLTCQMNASSAAKQLHVHRNTLQHRLERYQAATGVDLRSFAEASAAYMTIAAEHRDS